MLLKVTDAWLIERTVSMDFRTSTKQEAPYAIMKLEGELDFASKDHLVFCVEQFLAAGSKHIRLDVTALRFCDASGLSALVHAKRMCDEAGGSFGVYGAVATVAEVVKITGLDVVFGSAPMNRPSQTV